MPSRKTAAPASSPAKPAASATAGPAPARKRPAKTAAAETAKAPAEKTPPAAKAAKPAKPAKAAPASSASQALKALKAAKSVRATKPAKPAKSVKEAAVAKPAKPAKAPKQQDKPVRDSFTMPEADFALIATLKQRALAARRETKKSELLRAGLHALAAMDSAALMSALAKLAPVKVGRPKKGH
jgi:hypothetical protein